MNGPRPRAPGTGWSDATCANCGGELDAKHHVRLIACRFCRHTQPNPRPLLVGQEVIADGELATVVGVDGPDAIRITGDRGVELVKLEEVAPVAIDQGRLKPGVAIFARTGGRWCPTHLAAFDSGVCTVMHDNGSFRSAFFDKKVPMESVRVRVPAPARERFGWFAVRALRFGGDPAGSAFSFIITAMMFVFVAPIVLVVGWVAVAILFPSCGK